MISHLVQPGVLSEAGKSKYGKLPWYSAFGFISLLRKSGNQIPVASQFRVPFFFISCLFKTAKLKLTLKFMNQATEAGKGNEIFPDRIETLNKL